ncbi:hypothetical protein BWK59_06575 [Flavobacterium davisii]|uniref:DUF4870 domain-containing protein n=1 Tax=Flavobacterium davisii TaxID=2906077 RepID=A0A246GKT7_9FLAO|nr:DUF4870 domain-containing protein [Flavobacterium davisii]OWP84204.1 hypothetical protein BWK59_06575 [Flavobacterium davisii]
MKTSLITRQEKNYAFITHLSAFSKLIFPLTNYIIPIIIWNTKKKESSFIDFHGKQIINFQLSILLYTIIAIAIAIPCTIGNILSNFSWKEIEKGHFELESLVSYNLSAIFAIVCFVMIILLKTIEFFYIIYGAIKAHEGFFLKYPLTINFLK